MEEVGAEVPCGAASWSEKGASRRDYGEADDDGELGLPKTCWWSTKSAPLLHCPLFFTSPHTPIVAVVVAKERRS
ncbi:hypothetical protein CRG98_044422 [Punica granatum]|uniref:Uncharacterized protein n=1 Tax=Punica granatum TaxID=22663 RepID=A0A2I0HTV7_PUNGR|nr:hypothetical protein CRG98_044422 [Punica granatum]